MAVEDDTIIEPFLEGLPEIITQIPHTLHCRQVTGELTGHAKTDGEQSAFSPGAAAAFMPSAVD